jgi:hypothetical protein
MNFFTGEDARFNAWIWYVKIFGAEKAINQISLLREKTDNGIHYDKLINKIYQEFF